MKYSLKVKSLSRVRLFATPWTVAHQAPPSMGFSRQEYWSGLPFPSPGIFPTQGSNLGLPHCKQTLYHLSHQGSLKCSLSVSNFLEEISSLSHSIVFLYFFAVIAEEGFLISSCNSLELCIQMLISFLFSFAFHFSSFHRYL